MSYLPLSRPFGPQNTVRNRGWHWDDSGSPNSGFHYRYLAPCIGVTDDNGVYRHDCSATSQLTPTTSTDLCGKPFRPGSNFVVKTAAGLGVTCGGRRNR